MSLLPLELHITLLYVGFDAPINVLLKNVTAFGNKYSPLLSVHYTNSSIVNVNGFIFLPVYNYK